MVGGIDIEASPLRATREPATLRMRTGWQAGACRVYGGPPPADRRPVDSGWEHECDTLAWALRRMLTKGSGGPALIAEGPGGLACSRRAPGAWRIPVPAGMARRVRPPSKVRRRLLFSSPRQRLAEPPGSHRPAVLRRG